MPPVTGKPRHSSKARVSPLDHRRDQKGRPQRKRSWQPSTAERAGRAMAKIRLRSVTGDVETLAACRHTLGESLASSGNDPHRSAVCTAFPHVPRNDDTWTRVTLLRAQPSPPHKGAVKPCTGRASTRASGSLYALLLGDRRSASKGAAAAGWCFMNVRSTHSRIFDRIRPGSAL